MTSTPAKEAVRTAYNASMDDQELLAALKGVSAGDADATALVQRWFDRFHEAPPSGIYRITGSITVGNG